MPRFWDFSLPTQIQFGCGGLRRIGQFARSRNLLPAGRATWIRPASGVYSKARNSRKADVRRHYSVSISPTHNRVVEQGAQLAAKTTSMSSLDSAAEASSMPPRESPCSPGSVAISPNTPLESRAETVLDTLPVIAVQPLPHRKRGQQCRRRHPPGRPLPEAVSIRTRSPRPHASPARLARPRSYRRLPASPDRGLPAPMPWAMRSNHA